jgi:hypothetical protein
LYVRTKSRNSPVLKRVNSPMIQKGLPVEYRGIAYSIRARLGRDEWIWTIYPHNAPTHSRDFSGTLKGASDAACRGIDRWLRIHRQQDAKL